MTSMIITGKKRSGPRQLADYLTAKGDNENVIVRQIGSYVAKNVKDALLEMWAVADGSRAKDYLYHATINPRIGVKLTQEQWKQAVDTLEKNLNLRGHQRVVIEHEKKGRIHYHVVWNRVNPHTGRTKKLSFDRKVCRATALQLGSLFKLEPTPNKGQSYKRGDIERYKRTGIHPRTVKRDITYLWKSAKSGKGFAASLNDYGYMLALGKRGQFVLLDQAGSVHGLTRRIEGGTAKTIRRGLLDIDRATIPTIAEAKRLIKGKGSGTKGTSTTGSAGSFSARYAALVGPIDPPSITYRKSKAGKSDGEGGMVSAASAFKFSAKEPTAPNRWTPERPKHQNGANRRYQNIWVPMERRELRL